ncbi:hypothetical protein [Actinoallomurus acaciae]|uniref:Uncharacterized protein n=1 Tax=Actinoallomurus acaciae TaxID=502577 RepID=A0ABV5YEK6_9ACTN
MRHDTTEHLIADLERLRRHLGVGRFFPRAVGTLPRRVLRARPVTGTSSRPAHG